MEVGERINQTERRNKANESSMSPVVMAVEARKGDNRQSGRRKNGEIADDDCYCICEECPMWTVETVMVNGGNERDRRLVKQAMVGDLIGWLHGLPVLELRRGFGLGCSHTLIFKIKN